jgi:hypothetical protein
MFIESPVLCQGSSCRSMVQSFRSVLDLFRSPVQRQDRLIPGFHHEDRTIRMIKPTSVISAAGMQGDES